MGGRSGGGTRATLSGDTTYKGQIKNVESLVHMKDPQMYKAAKEAIARYAAVMGVPERNVKLADLDGSVLGIGGPGEVYLNKAYFNQSAANMKKIIERNYKKGHMTTTNKAVAHALTHELAHASWVGDSSQAKHIAAAKEIKALYKTWSKDRRKSGYGTYAASNVDEFWAETVTKAVYGKSDKYTKAVKSIAKKYKL